MSVPERPVRPKGLKLKKKSEPASTSEPVSQEQPVPIPSNVRHSSVHIKRPAPAISRPAITHSQNNFTNPPTEDLEATQVTDFVVQDEMPRSRPAGNVSLNTFAAQAPASVFGAVKAAKKPGERRDQSETVGIPTPAIRSRLKLSIHEYQDVMSNVFCLIPPGKYQVGQELEEVELKTHFSISKYPVTKAQFFMFLAETPNSLETEELNTVNTLSPYPNCPMLNVSWNDAKEYCRWLRAKTGEYYNIPSAEEWEIAARGNDGRIYPWGNDEPNLDKAIFFDGEHDIHSCAAVDYLTENLSPFGAVGMVGNVMEWTNDQFDDERDPHILKGGSWRSQVDFLNTGMNVLSYPPTRREDYFGFRLMHVPKEHFKAYYKENMA